MLKSFEEFNEWKANTQRQTITQFIKRDSFETSTLRNKIVTCHRSSRTRRNPSKTTDEKFSK